MSNQSKVSIGLGEVTNSCFVAMPFHGRFEVEYLRVIKPAIEATGLDCIRGDEIYARAEIVQDVWRAIRQARVIVGELSEQNPNVMYEIGLAHAIGKHIVLLKREKTEIPFNLRALRVHSYDPNNPYWGEDLRSALENAVRQAIDMPQRFMHLASINTDAVVLPPDPTPPKDSAIEPVATGDLAGMWRGSWKSIKADLEHIATLTIPLNRPTPFSASMIVEYHKEGEMTIVHETLTGILNGEELSLTGIGYSYFKPGKSSWYSLDSFRLRLSQDRSTLKGKAIFKHRTLDDIVFHRVDRTQAGQGSERAMDS